MHIWSQLPKPLCRPNSLCHAAPLLSSCIPQVLLWMPRRGTTWDFRLTLPSSPYKRPFFRFEFREFIQREGVDTFGLLWVALGQLWAVFDCFHDHNSFASPGPSKLFLFLEQSRAECRDVRLKSWSFEVFRGWDDSATQYHDALCPPPPPPLFIAEK